ncbi:S1 family peptidase [Roseivirga echinicomitans]|uniref:Serine protease n=1 Tax=Roseivirga echinicomitans TaxID=296218 RepID=A0A150XDK7_9BACT|nr:serine protease [Roseivirga echinicomitans]KYG76764.1 hypothetical protein AWN68_06985 [Roseivirga echinicomitans]
MFIEAIETAAKFTRPIHTISRTYSGKSIIPGAATLFLINDEGYALTCKHVIELLVQSENVVKNYNLFKEERDRLPRDGKFKRALKGLLLKYKIDNNTTIQLKNTFLDCIDKMSGFTWHLHPDYDLAILKFNDFTNVICDEYPKFKKDASDIKQGAFLCRLGFPFPEFTNFKFNDQADDIEWTKEGVIASPRFPIEGMITRFLRDGKGRTAGIELSTPGLRGQSGGPLFNSDGVIYGMQSRTKNLHLGFDIENKKIVSNGESKKVSDYSFIHLGECIHVSVIKEFLTKHKVKFQEE